jgi:hypothetical protein
MLRGSNFETSVGELENQRNGPVVLTSAGISVKHIVTVSKAINQYYLSIQSNKCDVTKTKLLITSSSLQSTMKFLDIY